MSGELIGYIRVSSNEQNTDRQLEGLKLDKVFTDKASGKSAERPALLDMLTYVRDGDTIIVHSMDRLARDLDDLRKLVKQLTNKKVKIKFVKESLEFTGEDSPMSNLLLSVMGAFAEFERSLIKERQMEGIALAKKRSAYKGRKRALDEEQIAELKQRIALGERKNHLAEKFNISRETLYKYIRNEKPSSIHI